MSLYSEQPNPLRPYYIPPSIGSHAVKAATNAPPSSSSSGTVAGLGSSAQDILSDFDYTDYLGDSPFSLTDSVTQFLGSVVRRYSGILISQPFEVAKTVLQVNVAQADLEELNTAYERRGRHHYHEEEPYPSDDESTFFSPTASVASPSPHRLRRPHLKSPPRHGEVPTHLLRVKNSSSLLEVLLQLWTRNGPTSVWKGSNSTFFYSVLLPTLDTFVRGLLAAVLGYPEDSLSVSGSDILTASSPKMSLMLSCISSALSVVILSPIDTARTLLMLTPQGHGPKSLYRSISLLPSSYCLIPSHLLPITILTSTLPKLIQSSAPLFIKSYLSLDPILNPSSWSLFTLMASGLEICVRMPLETVLRRAQIATFTSPGLRRRYITRPASSTSSLLPTISPAASETHMDLPLNIIVPTPPTYRGIIGTMWDIVYEEGDKSTQHTENIPGHAVANTVKQGQKRRRGQGIRGLYRGWRLEVWTRAGIWGSDFLGSLSVGNEVQSKTLISPSNIAYSGKGGF